MKLWIKTKITKTKRTKKKFKTIPKTKKFKKRDLNNNKKEKQPSFFLSLSILIHSSSFFTNNQNNFFFYKIKQLNAGIDFLHNNNLIKNKSK
jgi:hypothetical protein